jgi:Fic/DOC family N-terminal
MPTTSTRAGRWIRQQSGVEGFSAFVPAPLPPSPPLKFSPELQRLSEAAGRALGRLEGVSASLEPDRLLYMYVRKEAVLSSAIEGTQSTLSDLLRFEAEAAPGTPVDEVNARGLADRRPQSPSRPSAQPHGQDKQDKEGERTQPLSLFVSNHPLGLSESRRSCERSS